MKKIISLIIIATMLVFSFASCNLVDLEKNTRTTITAEEWAALDTTFNYTLVMTRTASYTYGDQTHTSIGNQTLKFTPTSKYYFDSTAYDGETDIDEYYYTIKDEKSYSAGKNGDGNWVATRTDWTPESLYDYIELDDEMTFADLTYDETKKAYTCTTTEDGVQITYTYYFEDGNLVKLEGVMGGESNGAVVDLTATIIVSNIGTTVVDVPANITYPEN